MFGSAPAYASLRETDAAARAFVAGDTAPLLRLMAETQADVDSRDDTQTAALFSSGLAAANCPYRLEQDGKVVWIARGYIRNRRWEAADLARCPVGQ